MGLGPAFVLALTVTAGAAGLSRGQEMVPTEDPAHPRVRYLDSLVSLNDRCPVRGGALNPTYKPVYVNGRPVGFC
jgi:hypothetical protein